MMAAEPSGPGHRLRLAGFALLGVAVVATGLGVFTAVDGNASSANASAPPSTTRPAVPPATTGHPATTTSPRGSSTTAPAPTGSTAPAPGSSAAGQPVVIGAVPVRVYNNGTIKGLANRAADDFRTAGYDVVEVGNYAQSQGVIPTSTVYYSDAPGEQAVAEQLAQRYSMRVQPRFPGIAYASPGVIVIVTDDFRG